MPLPPAPSRLSEKSEQVGLKENVMTREVCKACWRANPIGFHVPNRIWDAVVPMKFHDDVLCISCFTRMADEGLIEWDKDIALYPVSLFTTHDKGDPHA